MRIQSVFDSKRTSDNESTSHQNRNGYRCIVSSCSDVLSVLACRLKLQSFSCLVACRFHSLSLALTMDLRLTGLKIYGMYNTYSNQHIHHTFLSSVFASFIAFFPILNHNLVDHHFVLYIFLSSRSFLFRDNFVCVPFFMFICRLLNNSKQFSTLNMIATYFKGEKERTRRQITLQSICANN